MIQIDQARIEQSIIEQAVGEIADSDDLRSRVASEIDRRIEALFESTVSNIIDEKVRAITLDGFEREYIKRDAFGKPIGEPTTISKELERVVHGYWKDRVDKDGKPTKSDYNFVTRAEYMMMKICADDFSKEMNQHVVNVGGALKDHFREVLNQHVGIMLNNVFRVESIGDKAARRR